MGIKISMRNIVSILSCLIVVVSSWKFKKYPYADLNIEQKVKFDGYPFEIYQITTKDKYILTLYRIPYGRNSTSTKNRSPIFLIHGMFSNAELYFVPGRYKAMPYYFADSGFDVWIMNGRGCYGSQKHLKYNIDRDEAYWNFGFQELAVYDLTSNIDFIVEKTKKKVFIIGHSQGTTLYYIMSIESPAHREKIKMAVMYAPSVLFKYLNYPTYKIVVYLSNILEGLYQALGIEEGVPFIHIIAKIFVKPLCKEQTYFIELCELFVASIGTHESFIIDRELVPTIAGVPVARVSRKQLLHYLQLARSGIFQKYDYGPVENRKLYNETNPPIYNMKYSTPPCVIFFAPKDEYCSDKCSKEIAEMLPNVVHLEKVKFEYFTHIDFLFGNNASTLVYDPTIQLFNDYNKQNNEN